MMMHGVELVWTSRMMYWKLIGGPAVRVYQGKE